MSNDNNGEVTNLESIRARLAAITGGTVAEITTSPEPVASPPVPEGNLYSFFMKDGKILLEEGHLVVTSTFVAVTDPVTGDVLLFAPVDSLNYASMSDEVLEEDLPF